MLEQTYARARRARRRGAACVEHAAGGLNRIVVHELGALSGHYADLRERLAVARRARGLGDLLRDQFDLVAETRLRLRHDQQIRRQLLRDWMGAMRAEWQPA